MFFFIILLVVLVLLAVVIVIISTSSNSNSGDSSILVLVVEVLRILVCFLPYGFNVLALESRERRENPHFKEQYLTFYNSFLLKAISRIFLYFD